MTAASDSRTASGALAEGAAAARIDSGGGMIEQMRAEQQTPPGAKLAVGGTRIRTIKIVIHGTPRTQPSPG